MPAALVVAVAHERVDAALHLDAGDERGEYVPAGIAVHLRQGQHHRGHRRAGMAVQPFLHVVEIERVRATAVDQRRLRHADLAAVADEGGLRGAAIGRDLVDQDLRQRLLQSGQCDPDPVQQAMLRHLDDILGQGVEGQRHRMVRERARDPAVLGLGLLGLRHWFAPVFRFKKRPGKC